MRRLAFIVTFLVGSAGVFQWLMQGFSTSWEPRLRSYIETTAGRLTQTRVHIDSIAPSFIHRVRLMNVRVSEQDPSDRVIFQAADIELTISLIDLPRALLHHSAYEAIGLVSIKNPWVRLSHETIARHASRQTSTSSFPPWFTLAWEGGTLQWVDARAPRGVWTLYQAQGAFRIRGPQMNFAIRGSVQEARSLRFQFGSFGHRWNAQMIIAEGQVQTVLAAVQSMTKKSFWPPGWSIRGGFHFEARASGRTWPAPGEDLLKYLDQAVLTFLPSAKETAAHSPSVGFAGNLTYKKRKLSSPKLTFDSPWLEGTGQVELALEGTQARPEVTLKASIPAGRIGDWPFEDAVIHTRYLDDHWELIQNSFRFLNGRVSAKGTVASEGSDVAFTADHVSLAALGQSHGVKIPEGGLNVSCALTGPFDNWHVAGAWWLTAVQWGQNPVGDARGDFEITSEHFQAQAKSDNSRFRFALEGNDSGQALEIDRLEVHLPSGASLTGAGQLAHSNRQLQGTLEASGILFPSDLPFLPVDQAGLTGALDAHAKVSGTLEDPSFKGILQSSNLLLAGQALGKASMNFLWTKTRADIAAFHVEPGIDGAFAAGEQAGHWSGKGFMKMLNARIGQWPITRGSVHVELKPDQLDITELTAQVRDLTAHWQGVVSREKIDHSSSSILLEGKGTLSSPQLTNSTDIPIHLSGRFTPQPKGLQGVIQFDARALEGVLKGVYSLSGTADHPEGEFSAHIDNARWRAFQFSSELEGHWGPAGLKPLLLNGRFKSGGGFQFKGLLTPEGQAQGTVILDAFNLRPLGESLHFPKSLDGSTKATLSLSGPLAKLTWNGHLEGGPFVYAGASEHPFKLEQFAIDMTVAALEADPSITHLTLTGGQAKTQEELIRFKPGSFVEFAGDKPARLALGTEIRNLHLGIFTLFGGLDLDGTWQIKPEGFAIQTKAQTHSLFINDYELDEGILLADYYNGILKFPAPANAPPLVTGIVDFHKAPQLKFTDFFISGKERTGLELSGDIGPSLWDFKMAGRSLDMGILGELAGFPYPVSGTADVQVHGKGDPKHPHVDGKVDLENGAVLGLAFHSGSAAFSWQDTRITFTKLFLNFPGRYNLEGAGSFPLLPKEKNQVQPQDHAIDFSVRLRDSNLGLLKSFSQEVKEAKGSVEGLIQIKGTLEDPLLKGSLRVTNGDILGAHYFRQLRNAALSVDFEGDNVIIRDLRGKSGEGEFRGSGTITLAGFTPSKYDLKLEIVSAKGLEVQVPELAIPESPLAKRFKFLTTASRADLRGHVSLRGPAEAPVFSGVGIISNGHFTFPPSHKNPPSPAILDWFRRIYWDTQLTFQDGAWFENELVQAGVSGKLKLQGPSDKLRVDGGLDIPEGKISYLGLQFDIQQARYDIRSEINGDTVVNTPYVRGVAECQIQAVDTVSGVAGASGGSRLNINDVITLNIDYAPVDQIKPRLTSAANPTLSQEKLLARVTQTDIENLTPAERTSLYQKQIVSMIDSSLTTPLAQNVLKKTGIADRVRVQHVFDPNAVSGQDLNATAVPQQQSTTVNLFANSKYTVEKDLSDRLSLGYGVRFVPTAVVDPVVQQQKLDLVSDVQLSYRWFRNIYLRGDFELPSSNPNIYPERKVTIEPRWRFGWWGNTNKPKPPKKPDLP